MDKDTAEKQINQDISELRGCTLLKNNEQSYIVVDQQRCCKLYAFNWLSDIGINRAETRHIAEIRFKNDRKDFFWYPEEIQLKEGELVAVEASPGHDIGIVSLTGDTVRLQMRRKNVDPENKELKRIFRHARLADIEKWFEAVSVEDTAINKTRVIAMDLGLDMKINDVEYQGDKTKAIFYYTASERVDFRELIKKLAEAFKIRIEMRQIGVRQEAAKLGGIGSCGRELCCSSYMSGFQSVTTNSARVQQLTLNPQKLAGQCGKLKCCLNYEVDDYMNTLKEFPDCNIRLKTTKGEAVHLKSDVFKRVMWYGYTNDSANMMAIHIDQVNEIIGLNKKGKLPNNLEDFAVQHESKDNVENSLHDDFASFI
jgi:cell fate regulator YaaT (PSP1 superfamily)